MNFEGVAAAIYSRLAGYTALTSLTTSIGYERPQPDMAESLMEFPFTIIEDVSSRPWDTKTSNGGDAMIQVTTYCRPTASKSAVELANETAQAAYDALHDFDLVVSGSNVVNCLLDSDSGNVADPDGVTRYRALTFVVKYGDA